MATLLRKVLESVSQLSGLSARSSSDPNIITDLDRFNQIMYLQTSSTGEFDRMPLDIFFQILKILGPKESAKLRAVCKSWKFIISDNKLWIYFLQNLQEPWDSIFFAEIHLRSGYALQRSAGPAAEVSFMHIYGQRSQVPGAVIIDAGSGYCKYGWSKYASPSGRSATFLEFGNIMSPMPSRLGLFFSTICSRMQVKTYTQPIVVSIQIPDHDDAESAKASARKLEEAIYSTLFNMNVPAVCVVNQATLALFAARRISGIVVNVGFHQTSVVPILHGKVMHEVGVKVVGVGAFKLTGYLREKMQQNNIHVESLYTVRTLKENLCYVALNYEAELSKDTEASFRVASDGWFTLSKERFQTGEVLFQPHMAGVQGMGIHQAVALCMDRCHDAEWTTSDGWYKTIVLAGGSACLPGLAARLEKELYGLLPPFISRGIKVIPPPYGVDSAWFGAKLISNLSSFPGSWCMTKKQYSHWTRCKLLW